MSEKIVTKEEFYELLPKGWKSKSMMGWPVSVVYYMGNWNDETYKKVGHYFGKYKNSDKEEYTIIT